MPTPHDETREYDVRFPRTTEQRQGSMRIRATRTRIYDDLTPDPRADLVRALDRIVRPGDRVLDLGAGTGASAHRLAHIVGPSGGVVALDRDGESVRFARQRYPNPQVGFELGWTETLSGELDHAFDAAVAVDPLRDTTSQIERARCATEILRVIRPGGHLLCVGSSSESWEQARRAIEACGPQPQDSTVRSRDWRASLYRLPGGDGPDEPAPGT
ncbi:MAG: methyltransferase domain-containing protein [Planctomycetota bacterium]